MAFSSLAEQHSHLRRPQTGIILNTLPIRISLTVVFHRSHTLQLLLFHFAQIPGKKINITCAECLDALCTTSAACADNIARSRYRESGENLCEA